MARYKLSLRLKRVELANQLLEWLDAKQMRQGSKAFESIILPFAREKDVEIYEVWKAWDILKEAGLRATSTGPLWAILGWESVEVDGDGNIIVSKNK